MNQSQTIELNEESIDLISFDIETYDPNLKKMGTGVYREEGHILCVAFSFLYSNGAIESKVFEYNEENLMIINYILSSTVDKVGANILYDIDWLTNSEGFKINGRWNDVQIAEPLIDEYSFTYKLDALGKKYLNVSKGTDDIDEYAKKEGWKGDSRQYLYKMPIDLVMRYAMNDTELTLKVFLKQIDVLKEQELFNVYLMETDLLPLLNLMRKNGVRINTVKRDQAIESLRDQVNSYHNFIINWTHGEMKYPTQKEFNFNSPIDMKNLFDFLKLEYKRRLPTQKMIAKGIKKGNPILDQKALEQHKDIPIIEAILNIKKNSKCLNTFFLNSFTDMEIDEFIHCNFHPLRSDVNGTISGRLSSSLPNLQQVPSRDPELGKLCRGIFIPFSKNHIWGRLDWNQIEYRIIAHYAVGPGAVEIRKRYNEDPNTDYHTEIQLLAGWELTEEKRKLAKNLNFGAGYGMGALTASKFFGWELEFAESILQEYHKKVPFMRQTLNGVSRIARNKGFIHTIEKRRARVAEHYAAYKMFNRLIQGTAADIMKRAMTHAYAMGLFDILIPHLTVHDELDVSIPKTKKGAKAFLELKNVMETCVKLDVPITADAEVGPNWAELTKVEMIEDVMKEF